MSSEGDPYITFDEKGICNYCKKAEEAKEMLCFSEQGGDKKLREMFERVKQEKKNDKYDCMIGLSGGLDSSYLAYIGYKFGLRMLAVHIDDGFDTEITKRNVKKICDSFHIDLIIEKPDKEQFCDLTKAFIRAGVPDIAIPQDNVLFAALYKYTVKNHISYFLSGSNFALESILQVGNSYDASDKVHIKNIHKKFGDIKLKQDFPLISAFEKRVKYGYIHKIQTLKPLNYIDYNADKAMDTLQNTCNFEYYGDKHCESIFTKFMQRYYLPQKFQVDKRRSHYSSMIISGQMTREEALERLKEPLYKEEDLAQDKKYILNQIDMSEEEFDKIMMEEPKSHDLYKKAILNQLFHWIMKFRKY